jgi:type VI secretion system protein VasD
MRGIPRTVAIALGAACLMLAACKAPPPPKPPKPQVVKLSIAISPDANPDAQHRPSPIVLRVYQLKDDAAFKDADFFALFDKEQGVLGGSLISREEFELAPGQQKVIDYQLSLDARFVGVAAAYRDISNSVWRTEIGSQDKGLAGLAMKNKMNILAGRASVAASTE